MLRYAIACFILIAFPARAGEPNVIASVKPLHSLVAAVMEDAGEPVLLVDGAASPHDFALRPSQRRALEQADIVFYMGDDFELFLDKTLAVLPGSVRRVPMEKISELLLLPPRKGVFSPQGHGKAYRVHDARYDLHLWLDPANAGLMVREIARVLGETYPEHEALYAANARRTLRRLDVLDAKIKKKFEESAPRPFIVFHDSTQYFERAYGLSALAAFTSNPDITPGARHLRNLRKLARTADGQGVCYFSEPFQPEMEKFLDGGGISATIDPEGVLLEPGPELYFRLMEDLENRMTRCFSCC